MSSESKERDDPSEDVGSAVATLVLNVHSHAPAISVDVAESPAASPSPLASPSASASSAAAVGSDVFLPLRFVSVRTVSIAQRNHFLRSSPLVVVAVDNAPLFKTVVREGADNMTCEWDLGKAADVQAVHGGIALAKHSAAPSYPSTLLPLSSLRAGSRLQVHQEDFSRQKVDDDMGGYSIPLEEVVAAAWKKTVPSAAAASNGGMTSRTARGSAASSAASASSASSAPTALLVSRTLSFAPASAAAAEGEGEWTPLALSGALLDRETGRSLGSVELQVEVGLKPWAQFLSSPGAGGIGVLVSLADQVLLAPSVVEAASSPLVHVLAHGPSLGAFMGYALRQSKDNASVDGSRMRDRLYALVARAVELGEGVGGRVVEALFAEKGALWSTLFALRHSVPPSALSSPSGWGTWESLVTSYVTLVEMVATMLEPPPPLALPSAEELARTLEENAAAAKKEAARVKKQRKLLEEQGLDPDDPDVIAEQAEIASSAAAAAGKKKKKAAVLSDPPPLPPSQLEFGLNTLEVLHELFEAVRVHLCGFKKATEIDWTNEQRITELVRACELIYKLEHFLFRYGSYSDRAPSSEPAADSGPSSPVAASAPAASSSSSTTRMSFEDLRPFFHKESGDANALWLQKQMVTAVKKSAETLAENPDMASRLQQQADYFAKVYPVAEKSKKSGSAKKKSLTSPLASPRALASPR